MTFEYPFLSSVPITPLSHPGSSSAHLAACSLLLKGLYVLLLALARPQYRVQAVAKVEAKQPSELPTFPFCPSVSNCLILLTPYHQNEFIVPPNHRPGNPKVYKKQLFLIRVELSCVTL